MEDKNNIMRKDIDDPYRRNLAKDSYRMRAFGDKRSTADEYSGERIFISIKKKDSIPHHVTSKKAQVDHVVPIDTLIKENAQAIKKGYLTKEELREIANNDNNLAVTSHRINESKKQKSNFEYLVYKMKKGEPENITTTVNMLAAQARSRAYIDTALFVKKQGGIVSDNMSALGSKGEKIGTEIRNFTDNSSKLAAGGMAAGVDAGFTSAIVSGVRNIVKVANGKKSLKEAGKDIAQDTGTAFVVGSGAYGLTQGKKALARATSVQALEKISINQAVIVATTALTIMRYADGDISGSEAVEDIAMTGAGLYIVETVGGLVGGPAGVIAGSLVLAAVQESINVCKRFIIDYKVEKKQRQHYIAKFNRIYAETESLLSAQKKELEAIFSEYRKNFDEKADGGFQKMLLSALEGDARGIAEGISILMEPFSRKVCFADEKQFDDFFYDEDAVLKL